MPNFKAISKKEYFGSRWRRYLGYAFAAKDAIAPLVIQEVQKAVLSLPMAFFPQEEKFILIAVLGLADAKNLFVAPDGRWLATYIPASLRGYPFALANTEDGQQVLCIDEASGLVGAEGETFFNEDGTPSQAVNEILEFLNEVGRNRSATQRLCDLLQKHNLIQPWPIKVQLDNGEKVVEGFYRIDEAVLNLLSNDAFIELRDSGALLLAYCQLLSMQHLQKLVQLAQLHSQEDQKAALATTDVRDLNLEFLNNNGTISFGNLG